MDTKSPAQQNEGPAGDIDTSGPPNYHALAKMVKNQQTLVFVVENYLVPQDLEPDLTLTSKWIKAMCSEYELLTFFHKKSALEEMKRKVDAEVERKKVLRKLAANLKSISSHVDSLDSATYFFGNINENHERT